MPFEGESVEGVEGECAYIFGLFGAVVAGVIAGVSLKHARWELAANPFCLGWVGGGRRVSSPDFIGADWRCCVTSRSSICAPSECGAERWLMMAVLAMSEC